MSDRNTDESVGEGRRRFVQGSLAAAASLTSASHAASPDASSAEQSKPTYLVIYRPGLRWLAGQAMAAQQLREHGRYMVDLYRKGLLRFAGGFADQTGGAAMFQAEDDSEAQALIAADPAVTTQVFTFELRRWKLQPWEQIAAKQAQSR